MKWNDEMFGKNTITGDDRIPFTLWLSLIQLCYAEGEEQTFLLMSFYHFGRCGLSKVESVEDQFGFYGMSTSIRKP